jgi:hypothetical protein
MNNKINLNEISDFLSNMRKDKNTLSESTIAPVVAESVLQKPYPDSDLHNLTIEELSTKLNEARREQHRIPQFSKQEADHLKFVDEAVAVLNYRAVNEGVEMVDTAVAKYVADNLKTWKKGGGSIDLTVTRKNVRIQHGPMRTPSYVSLTLQPNGKWKIEFLSRFKSSHTAGDKIDDRAAVELLKSFVDYCQSVGLGGSEELDELSTELLGKYKSAAGKAASAADASGDFKTGNKRFSGIMKATKKQFANDEKKVKTESEELDEFVEYKNLTTHAAIHKQKQSNLASGVEHLAKKNAAMTAHHAAKKAGNHEEAAKHLETANAHHATAMKHHDAVQELSKKMAALHTN